MARVAQGVVRQAQAHKMHFQFQLTRYGNLNAHRGSHTHLIAQSDTPRLLGLAAGEFGEWHFGQ